MKKRIGIVLMSILIMGGLSACDVRVGIKHPNQLESNNELNASKVEDVNEKIKIDGLNKINIYINFAKVDISESSGNEIEIVSKSKSDNISKINIEKTKNILNIEEEKVKEFSNDYNIGKEITIKIPKEYKEDITLKYGVGEVKINNISLNDFKINGGAGELSMDKVIFNNMELNQGVGESSINIEEKCGNISINGGVGEINLNMKQIGGDLKYKGGVGEANISIPKNSPVYFQTKSAMGSCDIKAETSGENKYLFDLVVGIGSVKVR